MNKQLPFEVKVKILEVKAELERTNEYYGKANTIQEILILKNEFKNFKFVHLGFNIYIKPLTKKTGYDTVVIKGVFK